MREPGQGRMVAYAVGNLAAGIPLLAISTWAMRLYCPTEDEVERALLIEPAHYGAVSASVMVFAAFADLFVGFISDRTKSRLGRRLPYVLFGTPVLALAFLLLWFPPVNTLSFWNLLWFLIMLGLVHVSFTVVVNPYLALMPEVWRSDAGRVRVSVWMAVFNTIAQIMAFAVFGFLISSFADGGEILGLPVADGYKVAAAITFVFIMGGFMPTLLCIRETTATQEKAVPFDFWAAVLHTLRNPAFLPYMGASASLYAAQFLIVGTLPYLVVAVLIEDEKQADMIASLLLLGLVVITAFIFPVVDRLANRFKKKDLFMFSLISFAVVLPLVTLSGQIPAVPSIAQAIASCLLVVPGLAISLVIPRAVLAEVMDFDARRTGFRREAMYNGLEGLLQKAAGGLAPLIQGTLFSALGYSRAEPWGIVACGFAGGLLALAGALAFRRYPLEG